MKRDKVIFFRTDRAANDALAQYIIKTPIIEAREVTFTNDDYCHEFIFSDMPEREWYGVMSGIRVTSRTGEMVVFASWEDGDTSSVNTSKKINGGYDYGYEYAYNMFIRSLTMSN